MGPGPLFVLPGVCLSCAPAARWPAAGDSHMLLLQVCWDDGGGRCGDTLIPLWDHAGIGGDRVAPWVVHGWVLGKAA